MGLLMVATSKTSQGFEIRTWGETNRRIAEFDGLQLIAEDWDGREEDATGAADADTPAQPLDPAAPPF
jgi:hypothetical protein